MVLTGAMGEVLKLYRQLVFNGATNNRDDHAKNFSFIYANKKWQLSPAYDLVFSSGFNGQHTTTVNGNGLPDKHDILAVAQGAGISNKLAVKIYEEIREKTQVLQKFKNMKLP